MDIRDMSQDELIKIMEELNEPKFRAKQLYEWLHTHNVADYDKMTNLSKALRGKLNELYPLGNSEVAEIERSQDGTRKYLMELDDGMSVETVGMPIAFDENKKDVKRLTVCFSTQVGCPMECTFCATGQQGLVRDLSASEMVDQIIMVQDDFGERVGNVVAMGQGEPFLNYENLLLALRRMNTDPGLGIGARKITVSTCGLIDGIKRFAEEPEQFRLAVSLHSARQKVRDTLMPRCVNQPLDDLQEALIYYNLKSGRRVTLEYMLISGINDTVSDLDALVAFCDGIKCHINLIPLNRVEGSAYQPSSRSTTKAWISRLNAEMIPVSLRNSRGFDINGACGQLRSRVEK